MAVGPFEPTLDFLAAATRKLVLDGKKDAEIVGLVLSKKKPR